MKKDEKRIVKILGSLDCKSFKDFIVKNDYLELYLFINDKYLFLEVISKVILNNNDIEEFIEYIKENYIL